MEPNQPPVTQAPTSASRKDLPEGHIGYYNHTRQPLVFTSIFSNRGPTEIAPGKAVRDMHGRLVEFDPDLERQVVDGCLKRILPSDPRYNTFKTESDKIKKQNSVVKVSNSAVPVASAQNQQDANNLDYTTEIVDDTTYFIYKGQTFASVSAMNAYARSIGELD